MNDHDELGLARQQRDELRTALTRAQTAQADADRALADAQTHGATLKECSACKVKGSHPHPEGWVAFLDQQAGGIELELMQVYTPEQLEKYRVGGI